LKDQNEDRIILCLRRKRLMVRTTSKLNCQYSNQYCGNILNNDEYLGFKTVKVLLTSTVSIVNSWTTYRLHTVMGGSSDSSVGTVIKPKRWTIRSSIPGRSKRLFSSNVHTHLVIRPPRIQ
jgi:hypothetical protein